MSEAEDPLETLTGFKSTRRQLLVLLSLGAGGVASLLCAVPMFAFLFAPLLRRNKPVWRSVGRTEQFKIGQTVEVTLMDSSPLQWGGEASYAAAWLRCIGQDAFTAFSVDCTHLGCPVRWEPKAELFMCPCHGGVYYMNGDVAAGPPPDPLQQYPVRVENGVVQLQWKVLPPAPAVFGASNVGAEKVGGCRGCGANQTRA